MAKAIGIGKQNFENIILSNNFYVDKTLFIKEWWENEDDVTLITRPRRFGKTLNMSMIEQFFSTEYSGRGDLFKGLAIWQEEKYRALQGTRPVISFSFANVKRNDYKSSITRICQLLTDLYRKNSFLLQGDLLSEKEKEEYLNVSMEMPDVVAAMSIHKMCEYLYRHYGKRVIVLLDEYDTPLQEAYANGYWREMAGFTRDLFNATFKTNPYLKRAILTGITRIGKESIFSDLNNLEVVTTTTDKYADSFGFTEAEVFEALDRFNLSDRKQEVKNWYDGFTFGQKTDIYNPWSILNYLDKKQFAPYWANTSSNSLVGKLIREGSKDIKIIMEDLLKGKSFCTTIDEQIIYEQLDTCESAVWSLLLAAGYLKIKHYETGVTEFGEWIQNYELELTNFEVTIMFRSMVRGWFAPSSADYNDFIKALLQNNLEAMNAYMSRVSETVFSFFDTGKKPSRKAEPERFYHGFVLGLMMDLNDRYVITSNRESGFGRYDVQMEPRNKKDDAILLEFKVRNPDKESSLEETLKNALSQIDTKDYAAGLLQKGIPKDRIRKYGFAFEGKEVLIG